MRYLFMTVLYLKFYFRMYTVRGPLSKVFCATSYVYINLKKKLPRPNVVIMSVRRKEKETQKENGAYVQTR